MVSSNPPTMIVEVTLQDEFFEEFQQPCPIACPTWVNWVQIWLDTLSPKLPKADTYELTLRLTNDLEIQALNSHYRQKPEPTDVLAFAALEVNFPQPEHLETLYLGDIVISVETAARQAQQQDHSLTTELVWLAAHGLLHLLGWDHPDDDSLEKMLSQQETLLTLVGLDATR
jgi:probable rRNA maturation factor